MTGPLLVDLFCGAGGAAMGYHRAGFDIIGIDNRPQPHYPFPFIQADALNPPIDWRRVDAVHASPPCQAFTQISNRWRGKGGKADTHVDLLTPTRAWLPTLGIPYVIENVPGAVSMMAPSVTLHGGQFGLGVNRPRHFESNVLILAARAPRVRHPVGVYGKPDGRLLVSNHEYDQHAWNGIDEGGQAMGIDWVDDPKAWHSIAEAIPPAYTEHIGRQLLEVVA